LADPYAAPAPSPADVTAQQRANLVAQLGDTPALATVEQQLGAIQHALLSSQQDLANTNARLLEVQRQIAQNQQTLVKVQADLAAMVRATYVSSGQMGLTTALLSSDNFNQAFDRYRGAQHVNDQLVSMANEVATAKRSLSAEQTTLEQNVAAAQLLEGDLSAKSNHMTALIAQRNQALAQANARTQGVVASIDNFDNGVASALTPSSINVQGPCGNRFAYGQCTWYVASRRCVPWNGNAYQWWNNARALGYQEGHVPVAGAVVVWSPGGGGAGGVGHVAFVEAVGPAGGVPAGSFKLSEMNWGGWGRVDYRTLPNNSSGISGFVYGK
jgi:surface antigen